MSVAVNMVWLFLSNDQKKVEHLRVQLSPRWRKLMSAGQLVLTKLDETQLDPIKVAEVVDEADLTVVFVSPQALANDNLMTAITAALARYEAIGSRVVTVVLAACAWESAGGRG